MSFFEGGAEEEDACPRLRGLGGMVSCPKPGERRWLWYDLNRGDDDGVHLDQQLREKMSSRKVVRFAYCYVQALTQACAPFIEM